jgi:FkbM family methyltransferase
MNKSSIIYEGTKVTLSYPYGTGNVVRKIKKGRFYEEKFLKYIANLNLVGDYIDVGANIGNHSIFFAKFTGAKKVYSIEASNKVFEFLVANIKDNKLEDKIIAKNVAAGSKKGTVSLKVIDTDVVGGGTIIAGNDIEVLPIDVLKIGKPVVVKIDVEGYEYEVLKGLSNTLEMHHPELFIEAASKEEFTKISNYLSKFNYEFVTTYNNTATHHFSSIYTSNFKDRVMRKRPVRRLFRNS